MTPVVGVLVTPIPYSIALTKLDILDTFKEVKIGVAYRVEGKLLENFPGEIDVPLAQPIM